MIVTHPTGMLSCSSIFEDFYRLQTKLWEGKVFTPVCHSVHRRGTVYTHLGRHLPRQTPPRQTPLWADPPSPSEMATAADGTHPTGMHSCFLIERDAPVTTLQTANVKICVSSVSLISKKGHCPPSAQVFITEFWFGASTEFFAISSCTRSSGC